MNANRTKILSEGTITFSNQSFHLVRSKSYLAGRHLTQRLPPSAAIWKDMRRNVWERTLKQLYRLHTLRRRPPVQKRRLVGNSGAIQKVCSHTVLKCPYLARIGRPDIAWSLRCLARGITETKLVVNAWPFGSRTFVPIGWSCRKQTAVSLSSSTAEIISLDAGLRYESIPTLNLCDLVNVSLNSMISQKNLWNLIGEFMRDKLQSRSIGKCRRCLQRRAYSLRFKGKIIFMPMYNDLNWW